MADAKASAQQSGNAKSAGVNSNETQARQEKTLSLRLSPYNNSDQPVVSNVCNVHLAPGMVYIDFGFIEPGMLAALPRMAQQGEKMPEQVNGKLAVRVAMGYDTLAALHQQAGRILAGFNAAKKRVQ